MLTMGRKFYQTWSDDRTGVKLTVTMRRFPNFFFTWITWHDEESLSVHQQVFSSESSQLNSFTDSFVWKKKGRHGFMPCLSASVRNVPKLRKQVCEYGWPIPLTATVIITPPTYNIYIYIYMVYLRGIRIGLPWS